MKNILHFFTFSLFLSSCDKLTSSDKQEIDRQVARLSPEKEADFVLGKMLLTIKNGGDINDCETRYPYIGGSCEYPTALHIAVYQRKPQIAELLLKLGADPNAHISKMKYPHCITLSLRISMILLNHCWIEEPIPMK